jgi:hypothetical protein
VRHPLAVRHSDRYINPARKPLVSAPELVCVITRYRREGRDVVTRAHELPKPLFELTGELIDLLPLAAATVRATRSVTGKDVPTHPVLKLWDMEEQEHTDAAKSVDDDVECWIANAGCVGCDPVRRECHETDDR